MSIQTHSHLILLHSLHLLLTPAHLQPVPRPQYWQINVRQYLGPSLVLCEIVLCCRAKLSSAISVYS